MVQVYLASGFDETQVSSAQTKQTYRKLKSKCDFGTLWCELGKIRHENGSANLATYRRKTAYAP